MLFKSRRHGMYLRPGRRLRRRQQDRRRRLAGRGTAPHVRQAPCPHRSSKIARSEQTEQGVIEGQTRVLAAGMVEPGQGGYGGAGGGGERGGAGNMNFIVQCGDQFASVANWML